MDKNPLNKSLVNGVIPSACFAFAEYPMIKLPNIKSTLAFVKECRNIFCTEIFFPVPDIIAKSIKPTMIAGDSINAMTATM